ncbi:2-oxoglutarate/malate transporter [Nocardia vinacea]|uniref:2-oxoglutarate/malate transporter n=1 Tax=Nocardia vinacea TaxID=96468 RepID=UPI002E13AC0C|nr:2-oxoglutarate/malate transporter [Nocardia vinacea]
MRLISFPTAAGLGGFGFVLLAVVINVIYVRGRLPFPVAAKSLDAVAESFASVGDVLKKPSVAAPAGWLCTTVFAAGLLSVLWHGGAGPDAWALVGFAGVLMQNATFTCVEALRFGMASAARVDRGSVAGMWSLSNVLFGFNQVFLAIAVFGFTVAGSSTGLIPAWHAWLGYLSAALLFISSSTSPYNAEGSNRTALIGFIGWLGWAGWIIACSIALLRY